MGWQEVVIERFKPFVTNEQTEEELNEMTSREQSESCAFNYIQREEHSVFQSCSCALDINPSKLQSQYNGSILTDSSIS